MAEESGGRGECVQEACVEGREMGSVYMVQCPRTCNIQCRIGAFVHARRINIKIYIYL